MTSAYLNSGEINNSRNNFFGPKLDLGLGFDTTLYDPKNKKPFEKEAFSCVSKLLSMTEPWPSLYACSDTCIPYTLSDSELNFLKNTEGKHPFMLSLVLGDPGAASRDDRNVRGESLLQEREERLGTYSYTEPVPEAFEFPASD